MNYYNDLRVKYLKHKFLGTIYDFLDKSLHPDPNKQNNFLDIIKTMREHANTNLQKDTTKDEEAILEIVGSLESTFKEKCAELKSNNKFDLQKDIMVLFEDLLKYESLRFLEFFVNFFNLYYI